MNLTSQDIYVDTDSCDLWWGVYGFARLTAWEDIRIYDNPAVTREDPRIGFFCLCTRPYLQAAIEELQDDPDEREHVEEMRRCLAEGKLHMHYAYDHRVDRPPHELPYANLPLDERGLRPHYIELWAPAAEGIDLPLIESCVREFCRRFLEIDALSVRHPLVPDREQSLVDYAKHVESMRGATYEFAEPLIEEMMRVMSKSREDVLRSLHRSVGGLSEK